MTRVADELGTGASFGRARGVSARRQAVAATTGVPTAGAPDSRLRTLPLEQLIPTRFNPRRNFGTHEDLLDFGLKLKKKQLQPAVAVTQAAYLELWPDEASSVGTARYVIANGERRYRASQTAGLTTLEVVVDDDIATSRADFLDAVLSENNDREDLDPIERALGIKTMVEQLGGKAKVADHYKKSGGWVTQQMYLLDLVPDLQALVSTGELPVRETRALVKLSAEDQMQAWQARHTEREEERALPRPARKREVPAPPEPQSESEQSSGPAALERTFTAVKNDQETQSGPDPEESSVVPGFTAVKNQAAPASEPAPAPVPDNALTPPVNRHVPVPRDAAVNPAPPPAPPAGAVSPAPPRLPYDDGLFIGQHLAVKMEAEPYLAAVQVINRQCWDKAGAEASFTVLRSMLETAQQCDPDVFRLLLKDFDG